MERDNRDIQPLPSTVRKEFLKAVASGNYEITENYLQEYGVQIVNSKRLFVDNRTALHIAASLNRYDLCELLLQNGADISARDIAGKKPEELSSDSNIITLLQSTEYKITESDRIDFADTASPIHDDSRTEVRRPSISPVLNSVAKTRFSPSSLFSTK